MEMECYFIVMGIKKVVTYFEDKLIDETAI